MRLLNVATRKLEEFFEAATPRYAILSHTTSAVQPDRYRAGSSSKVDGCLAQAASDRLGHVWIDTCCIDKSLETGAPAGPVESERSPGARDPGGPMVAGYATLTQW